MNPNMIPNMRWAALALAAMLACAAVPALAQSNDAAVPPAQPGNAAVAPPAAQPQMQPPSEAAAPPAHTTEAATAPEHRSEAAPAAPALPPARFMFQRADNGFLRLDAQTGQVAFCSQHSVGWACAAVPEDRAALEKEIGRLQTEVTGLNGKLANLTGEVAQLKLENAALRAPPPPPLPPQTVPPKPRVDNGSGPAISLPTHEDIARARAFVADAWHRLVDMLANLQKDVMRKS
jgi:hypothetical protein